MAIAFRGVTGFATSFAKLLGVHKYLMECDKAAGGCRICMSTFNSFLVASVSTLISDDSSMFETRRRRTLVRQPLLMQK